jgi:hypothetical protein
MADLKELERTLASNLLGFATLFTPVAVWYAYTAFVLGDLKTVSDPTLAIPFTLLPILIYLGFVPRRLRYNAKNLEFASRFTGVVLLPWTNMLHWGSGNHAFLIEFDKQILQRGTLQICLWFYSRQTRNEFKNFLTANFPDRKTCIWFGVHGISPPRWLR